MTIFGHFHHFYHFDIFSNSRFQFLPNVFPRVLVSVPYVLKYVINTIIPNHIAIFLTFLTVFVNFYHFFDIFWRLFRLKITKNILRYPGIILQIPVRYLGQKRVRYPGISVYRYPGIPTLVGDILGKCHCFGTSRLLLKMTFSNVFLKRIVIFTLYIMNNNVLRICAHMSIKAN